MLEKLPPTCHIGSSSETPAKETFYANGAGDRRRSTSGKYSPQYITSKMANGLAFWGDFLNSPGTRARYICATTAMHPGTKNYVNRRLQRRSSQVGQWHIRTRLWDKSGLLRLATSTLGQSIRTNDFI